MSRHVRPFIVGAVASQLVLAAFALRRWYRAWGTTDAERRESLPGDVEVERPTNDQTHAVTIAGAPEDVWPWIVQIGTGRGGWYSYGLVERAMGLDVTNANEVRDELQQLAEGDAIPLAPGVALEVAWIEPRRLLLLAGHDPALGDCSWLFLLRPQDDGTTRLITRFRVRWNARGAQKALLALIEPGSFVMDRQMLLGIKSRAERLARSRVPVAV